MTAVLASQSDRFRHEALFYAGESHFVSDLLPFLRDGIERSEPTLVAVRQPKIAALRRRWAPTATRFSSSTWVFSDTTLRASSRPGRSSWLNMHSTVTGCAESASRSAPAGAQRTWRSVRSTSPC